MMSDTKIKKLVKDIVEGVFASARKDTPPNCYRCLDWGYISSWLDGVRVDTPCFCIKDRE